MKHNTLNSLYSDKQIEVLKSTHKADWFILINHGAKRSGKTIINNDIFLKTLREVRTQADLDGVKNPMFILAGATIGTIYQNILIELMNRYDIDIRTDKWGNFYLMGVYIVQIGHERIDGVNKIRGMTAYGAYINEGSLANKYVFDEIISRCSGANAKIIVDTNPDSPHHFLKKDYIDNREANILEFKWTLYDNPFLPESYVENIIKTTPSGVFTERNLKGNWTIGEGAIYIDYDEKANKIEPGEIPQIIDCFAGVDWGFKHYGAIVIIGLGIDGKYYLIEEHAKQFKDIDYWVSVAQEMIERYGDIPFYCDTARMENIAKFNQEGIKALNAIKDVLAGIEYVSELIKARDFLITQGTELFDIEINAYRWNEKTGEPVKENDDVQDSIRYALYSNKIYKQGRRANYSGKGARRY